MKIILSLLVLLICSIASFAQQNLEKISDSLIEEGSKLYRSEMASWYGTDIFLDKYKNRENIGGYFSYSENNIARCIFFSKGDTPKVLCTISFDSSYNVNSAQVDFTERSFTNLENELYLIRSTALKTINSDTLFKFYKNTSLNLVPLISNGRKQVYVLTGPKENGVVIFGNDYLLTFNQNNDIIYKKQLHRNIISINYGNKNDTIVIGTMHTHSAETGDFITATDICTLLLYEKFAKWQQHCVMSKSNVSIWDCNKNILTILTKEAWDKIYSDHKKKN